MHADEINVAATEELGKEVYHYHLHAMVLPVVEKEILWSKRCKDEKLRGTVKEVVNQISHSKKWKSDIPKLLVIFILLFFCIKNKRKEIYNMYKNVIKFNNGITLIALVITIIVRCV